MKPRKPQWSISALLALLAMVPALVTTAVVVATTLANRLAELEADVNDRGRLLAAALAESSQYGVAAANRQALESTMRTLIASDNGISALEVRDANQNVLASFHSSHLGTGTVPFEAPVRGQTLEVDLLDSTSSPHINSPMAGVRQGQVLGYVRVTMSSEPLLQARHRALLQAAILSALAAATAIALALALARRVRRPLEEVMAAVRRVRQGEFRFNLPITSSGELGELQRAFGEMAASVADSWEQLEDKVEARTSELRNAVEAVRSAEADRRRLIAHVNNLLEEERRRISLEIHDQLNSSLIAVRLAAATLADQSGEPLTAAEVSSLAQQIADTTEAIYDSARRIVKSLRPEVIDTLGFRGALSEMVRSMDQLHPRCTFSLRFGDEVPSLPPDLAMTGYRIVQEALNNVVKHAQASHATVHVSLDQRSAKVRIEVSDDGRGFDVDQRALGIGLIGMRERLEASGGRFAVHSGAEGTTVTAELPLTTPLAT